jgi:hypothetical protein
MVVMQVREEDLGDVFRSDARSVNAVERASPRIKEQLLPACGNQSRSSGACGCKLRATGSDQSNSQFGGPGCA